MEISVRPVPRGTYPTLTVDAVACTYNVDGFTPLNAVLIAYGIDRFDFARRSHMHEGEMLRVVPHRDVSPIFITTSSSHPWNVAPEATREIIKVASAEGCNSICLTHFMFLPGEFPRSDFNHCLHMAAASDGEGQLGRVVVDVDERYIEKAKGLLDVVHAQQAYAHRHRIARVRTVGNAEAGSADYQGWLAAEILCRSNQDDRCIEALKWLILATNTRQSPDSIDCDSDHKIAGYFLAYGMQEEEKDAAFRLAERWLEEKLNDLNDHLDFVPEFRRYIASL